MKRTLVTTTLVASLLASAGADAQDKKIFNVTRLSETLYQLTAIVEGGYPEKVVASVGPDGLLIVDSGIAGTAAALAEALKGFGKGLPKIIINTHSHIEHLGGNPAVGQGAVIVGHRNLRERYLHGLYYFGDFPPASLPNLTFDDALRCTSTARRSGSPPSSGLTTTATSPSGSRNRRSPSSARCAWARTSRQSTATPPTCAATQR